MFYDNWDYISWILFGVDVFLAVVVIALIIWLIIQLIRGPKRAPLKLIEEGDPTKTAIEKADRTQLEDDITQEFTDRTQSMTMPLDESQRSSVHEPVPKSETTETSSEEESDPLERLPEEEPEEPTEWINFAPAQLAFQPAVNGMQTIMLENTTGRRLAVKVLCTNNNVYRVEPVFTFLEPRQAFEAEVHRLDDGKPPKEEMLVFAFMECAEGEGNIRELFKAPNAKPYTVEFKIQVDSPPPDATSEVAEM